MRCHRMHNSILEKQEEIMNLQLSMQFACPAEEAAWNFIDRFVFKYMQ